MKEIFYSGQFNRDFKRIQKRGKNLEKLRRCVDFLVQGDALPQVYRDHPLRGSLDGFRDAHIEPDWVLIYKITETYVCLERTGTHSDLFDQGYSIRRVDRRSDLGAQCRA